MKRNWAAYIFSFMLLATMACNTLTSAGEPTATPGPIVTPTLAPTSTPDPNATVEVASDNPAPAEGTAETGTADGAPTAESVGDSSGDQGEGQNGTPEGDSGGEDENGGGSGGGGGPAACPAGGQNLALNPSFEGGYKPFGAFNELNHAPNWFPWWTDGQNNLRPEFKPAEAAIAPNRVHSGSTAQQYFKSFGQFKAGLYQSVLNVPAGSRLQFSAYGQAWSCEESNTCPDGRSNNPANMFMRVGIDPTGNTDWSADTIVWSAYFNPLDQWQIACVEAVAESDIVSVFLWASPDGPRQNQDIYWDDASLVVVP